MSEHDGAEFEGVAHIFVSVGSANAAGFDFHKHFVVADFGNVVFAQFELFRSY